MSELEARLRSLPKVELHQHVDGSIPPEVTWELMRHYRLHPVDTLEEMRQHLEIQDGELEAGAIAGPQAGAQLDGDGAVATHDRRPGEDDRQNGNSGPVGASSLDGPAVTFGGALEALSRNAIGPVGAAQTAAEVSPRLVGGTVDLLA